MKPQKKFLFFSIFLFSLLDSAMAQVTYKGLQPFWDLVAYIFNFLPSGATKYVFFKFIIWLLLASVLLVLVPKALSFLQSDDPTTKKNAKIVAWILSLIMSIGIPNKVLDLIFNTYSFIGALLLVAVGPALVFTITKDNKNKRIQGIAFLVSGIFLILFANAGTSAQWFNLQLLLDWVNLAGVIMMIIGIIMIISGGEESESAINSTNQSNANAQEDNDQNRQINPDNSNNTPHHETFDKERAKHSLILIDEILKEIEEFNKKLFEKNELIKKEINDYRSEIQILEELLAKIESLKEQISTINIINNALTDENPIRDLKKELESKLNLNSGHNITTAIRDLKTLELHLSKINQHIIELQKQQSNLITKSKNNLWKVDNSLEGYTQNHELENLIFQARHLIREIAAKIDEIKKIEHLNERAESEIIEKNKEEIKQGSNIQTLINGIKTLCDEVLNKKDTKKLGALKTNIGHLLHFLKTQKTHNSPGDKIAHKLRIHETLLTISNNLIAEGKISNEIIHKLEILKKQVTVITS